MDYFKKLRGSKYPKGVLQTQNSPGDSPVLARVQSSLPENKTLNRQHHPHHPLRVAQAVYSAGSAAGGPGLRPGTLEESAIPRISLSQRLNHNYSQFQQGTLTLHIRKLQHQLPPLARRVCPQRIHGPNPLLAKTLQPI